MIRHLGFIATLLLPMGASAQPLIFDDLPRGQHVGEGYSARGVHFSLTDFAVMGGLGEGDPGNWKLHGSNGTAFMGFNGNPSFAMDIAFDTAVTGFSMDAARANGSELGDLLEIEFWHGGTVLESRSIQFPFFINSWMTVSHAGPIDRVTFRSTGVLFHPYGVDNINFVVPAPGGAVAVIFAAGVVALRGRRRV